MKTAICFSVVAWLWAYPVCADTIQHTVVIPADAATHVNMLYPTNALGAVITPQYLNVNGSTGTYWRGQYYNRAVSRTLMHFTLGSVPQSAEIVSAKLRMYCRNCTSSASGKSWQTYLLTDFWNEATATWNNQPAASSIVSIGSGPDVSAVASVPIQYVSSSNDTGMWVEWDITNIVMGWQAGANFGVMMRTNDETYTFQTAFDGRRFYNPPYISVTFSPTGIIDPLTNGAFNSADFRGWSSSVSASGSCSVVSNPVTSGDYSVRMVTGSPVSVTQVIDTPDGPFVIDFENLWETTTGEWQVLLNNVEIASGMAEDAGTQAFMQRSVRVDDKAFFNQTGANLTFRIDGPSGSTMFLDNVSLTAVPEPCVVLAVGAFVVRGRRQRG